MRTAPLEVNVVDKVKKKLFYYMQISILDKIKNSLYRLYKYLYIMIMFI